ncbi:MAG: hypothetical protein QOJ54_3601 [Aliidongia sp.]|jgi:hypothetical protein|nr:hypothetical protein [Aliidongia sp.]
MTYAQLIRFGTVGGQPILGDSSFIDPVRTVQVRLLADYAAECLDSWPTRPGLCGGPKVDFPRTYPAGTILGLFSCESDALIAAGAAVLA